MSSKADALEAALGFAALEEGDDRIRPAAALHLGINPMYFGRAYLWGREFGPVTERTTMVAAGRRWAIARSNLLRAHFGGVLMDEMIQLEFEDEEDSDFDKSEHNYNIGATFGVSFTLGEKAGPLYFSASWDSHLFLAGPNGGLLLANGRKQTISILLGTQI